VHKKPIIRVLSACVLLAGCVSQQSQQTLANLQADCNSGNKEACKAATLQAQANQRELNTNTAVAAGVGALLGAAIVGAELSNERRPYGPDYHRDHDPRFIH
jgi:hypothetical protein